MFVRASTLQVRRGLAAGLRLPARRGPPPRIDPTRDGGRSMERLRALVYGTVLLVAFGAGMTWGATLVRA